MSYNLVDPTTGDLTRVAGGGFSIPVGTLIQQYKKKPLSGYLYCDGSTFDQNVYPALYMYLGTNVLPDYRECVMVGAEQNTTDTIATHDVYVEGEFKDDQMQNHKHYTSAASGGTSQVLGFVASVDGQIAGWDTGYVKVGARSGDTTHGKQKAVYVYIKATSGLAENQQDNVLTDVKDYVDNSNSYSTQEVKTGGKWIDGKPIYRKVLTAEVLASDNVSNARLTINFNIGTTNISQIVSLKGSIKVKGTDIYVECGGSYYVDDKPQLSTNLSSNSTEALCVLKNGTVGLAWMINKDLELTTIIEYTKTTDA